MRPNFALCAALFNSSDYPEYTYNGSVPSIYLRGARPKFITCEGCKRLCGSGIAYYQWADASQTITTWVLPVIGILVQAPYESHAFIKTLFALARWIGSPISTLAYTLWNMGVTGKCAMIVDMATEYSTLPEKDSAFGRARDSFFILSVMNQYSIKDRIAAIEAEKLLRIALFSDTLRLSECLKVTSHCDSYLSERNTRFELVERRRTLAQILRERRKKGVVPVFISFLWFFFALSISIQAAFSDLGSNRTAHDLALGLLMSWLPVLVLVTIVDRNPVAPEVIRQQLNDFVEDVRCALLSSRLRDSYMTETHRRKGDFAWTAKLQDEVFCGNFFTQFAGQGRLRWHYGVAHSILAGVETKFMAKEGRNWLEDEDKALTYMVDGPNDGQFEGIRSFDFRMLWQILSSSTIVLGTIAGAFVVSYLTPTFGLGCRSGGYLIYVIMIITSLTIELTVWWSTSQDRARSWIRNYAIRWPLMQNLSAQLPSVCETIDLFVLKPLDLLSSGWLAYIVFAQTFGSYQTCECMSSVWGGYEGHGYLDFETLLYYRNRGVAYHWAIGTTLSTAIMLIAFAFIVLEWCTQSHLSTENYEHAMQGLKWTRRFKRYTAWARGIPNFVIRIVKRGWYVFIRRRKQPGAGERRSLVWTWQTKRRDRVLPIIEAIPGPDLQDKPNITHVELIAAQLDLGHEEARIVRARGPESTELRGYRNYGK